MSRETRTREQVSQPPIDVVRFGEPLSPRNISPRYTFGEKITRQNFTAMLIQSFEVSQGALAAQVAYFEWLRIHHEFNWRTTLEGFRDARCLEALSDFEQERFDNLFRNVKKHKKIRLDLALPYVVTQLLSPEQYEISSKYFNPTDTPEKTIFMESLTKGIRQLRAADQ